VLIDDIITLSSMYRRICEKLLVAE
jgi:hypothetical protein